MSAGRRLILMALPVALAACGSVYDTNHPAPSTWVPTYNQPIGTTLPAAATQGAAVPGQQASPDGAEDRLREAKQLRDDGLISEKEYQQLRQRILGSL